MLVKFSGMQIPASFRPISEAVAMAVNSDRSRRTSITYSLKVGISVCRVRIRSGMMS
jgi:hypothetical protein